MLLSAEIQEVLHRRCRSLLKNRMEAICKHICEMNGLECEFTYTHEFAPTFNWKDNVQYVVKAAKAVVGEEHVIENCPPTMGSEDFGHFIQNVPGCFVFLGSKRDGEEAIPLHNSCLIIMMIFGNRAEFLQNL